MYSSVMILASYLGGSRPSHRVSPDSLISWRHPARRSTTHGHTAEVQGKIEITASLSTALANWCHVNMPKTNNTHAQT